MVREPSCLVAGSGVRLGVIFAVIATNLVLLRFGCTITFRKHETAQDNEDHSCLDTLFLVDLKNVLYSALFLTELFFGRASGLSKIHPHRLRRLAWVYLS